MIRQEVWRALAVLTKEGLSQIVIDKNVKALMSLDYRHFVIEKGRVLWPGTSDELSAQSEIFYQYLEFE